MTIMVTGALGPAGSALLRQLVARNVDVIGVDMAANGADGVIAMPAASSPAYLPALRALLTTYDVSLLIPTVSEELVTVAGAVPFLPTNVAISPLQGCVWANDKLLTMWHLEQHGVSVPGFKAADDPDRAPLGVPFVAKPRISRGGRGVRLCHDAQTAFDDGVILQEFASGEEFCPMVYLCDDPADDVVVCLRKTALEFGNLGNATGVVRDVDPEVERVALAAGRALGLRGAVDLDIRYTATGRPVVLEVNARCGANTEAAPEILEHILAHELAYA